MDRKTDAYSKVRIYYFTGTGNAEFAAREIGRQAERKGLNVKVIHIVADDPDFAELDNDTLAGFCYPTHGFNAPPVILRFLLTFPRGKADAFLLNTRAGMKLFRWQTPGLGGLALWLPALILKLKGYRIRGFRPLDMPSNWISLHPGLIRSAVDFLAGKCRKTLSRFAEKILSGKREPAGMIWLPLDILVVPIAVGYYLFGRFFLAKTFYASHKCTGCGLCAEKCPLKAIQMKGGRPYWTFRCESCMRCMNHCPRRAVETSHGFAFLAGWLIYSAVPAALFNSFMKWGIVSMEFYQKYADPLFYLFMFSGGFILLYAGYRALHFLLGFRWLNRLITWTSLTRFKWWNRYTFSANKESE